MDCTILPTNKILQTYKRYSLPSEEATPAVTQKMQFFYIGAQPAHFEKLKGLFDFGYTTGSAANAIFTLQRLLRKKDEVTIPDTIVAEGSLGTDQLLELHRFVSQHKILADMPFIIEGSGLSRTELEVIKRYTFVDDLILLNEFSGEALQQKLNFLKKTKQKRVHEPTACAVETGFPVFPDLRSFGKRMLDVVFATLLLLLLGPVLLLIALAVKLESGGPVLATSKRTGRGYRVFDMYTFRTTTLHGDDTNGVQHTYHTTRIGLFLRKTLLDELPLLINVLLGDMSLIGNRPLLLKEAAYFTTDEYAKRFMAPVGVTGLWQLQKREKEDVTMAGDSLLAATEYGDQPALYDFWMMANPQSAIAQKTNA